MLKAVGTEPPIAMMLSFTGIRGWEMGVRDDLGTRGQPGGFDRDPLLIPELLFETLDVPDIPKAVKPIIDSTWNAAGFAGSEHYDSDGSWVGERRP